MSTESQTFVLGKNVPKEVVGDGFRRQLLGYSNELMVARIEADAGAVGDVHTHPHTQVTYIESGVFDVTIDGVTKRLEAGDSVLVRSELVHGLVCVEAGVLLDVFNPVREDFLPE
ncbi:MAG: cupin domain-containing protein [Pseudomonadota bacterium]